MAMYKSLSNEDVSRIRLASSAAVPSELKTVKKISLKLPFSSATCTRNRAESSPETTQTSISGRESPLADDKELDTNIVRLNVGGQIFNTYKDTLRRYPLTLLGSLSPADPSFNRRKREYFFDRNPTVFACILDLYRTNELHLPRNVCGNAAIRELAFWEVPAIWVSACCWSNIHDAIQDQRYHEDIQANACSSMPFRLDQLRTRLWFLIYDKRQKTVYYYMMNCLLSVLIASTMVIFFLDIKTEIPPKEYYHIYLAHNCSQCTDELPPRRRYDLYVANMVTLGILLCEFVMKMVLCPNLKHFMRSTMNVLYGLGLLVCLVSHILEVIMEKSEYWVSPDTLDAVYITARGAHFVRMIRFLELLDSNASLHVMWIAVTSCRSELLLLLIVFTVLAIFFGVIAFFCESRAIHNVTASYGDKGYFPADLGNSLYWAVITMTTVGYGDMTPMTPQGRVVGSLCSVCGVIVLALPVAILTESFQQYSLRLKIQQEKRKRQDEFFKRNRRSVGSELDRSSV